MPSSGFELESLDSKIQPPHDSFVNVAAMDNPENPYLVSDDFKHYSAISNSELPIALKGTAQRLAVSFKVTRQSRGRYAPLGFDLWREYLSFGHQDGK